MYNDRNFGHGLSMKNFQYIMTSSMTLLFLSLMGCGAATDKENQAKETLRPADISIKTVKDIPFQPLNPARGDASPQARVLWGDITADMPSGMILKFADGFSSPPHIHNITYRGVVIQGALHNDDPDAAKMWMGPGSYWTQPAGENHITAAKPGAEAVSFLEIFQGPYLVQPPSEAFDNGELPINLEYGNMVWLGEDETDRITGPGELTYLWGDPSARNPYGTMLKMTAGNKAAIVAKGEDLRAVIISGKLSLVSPGSTNMTDFETGTLIDYQTQGQGVFECVSANDCLLYVRAVGPYRVNSR